MNSVSHPLRKISIADHTSFLGILVNYNLLQVVIVHEALFLTEMTQYILNSNVAIIIGIEIQERFSNGLPVV